MDEVLQKYFLEQVPPGVKVHVKDFSRIDSNGHKRVSIPNIELHCSSCEGQRFFRSAESTSAFIGENKPVDTFLDYFCRNCGGCLKTFAIGGHYDQDKKLWMAFKYGEEPSFGPPTPPRAIKLIGPDRDQFLKGRRCENQGLGVGAFVYYRRVVRTRRIEFLMKY